MTLGQRDKRSCDMKVGVAHLYSAPQPLTKLILMVHILVSW